MIQSFIAALTGSPDSCINWRVINDRVKGESARNLQGSLQEVYKSLSEYNQAAWGVFANVNQLDGNGYELKNVAAIRAHFIDLDDPLTSEASYQQAISSPLPPHFAVQSSPKKFHLYWLVEPYQGNDYFTVQQKKLAQLYNADPKVCDATRVLRVPGFYHCKEEPQLVQCWGIHNGARYTIQQLAASLEHVNIIERFTVRNPLGSPELAAPCIGDLFKALSIIDPNEIERDQWLSLTSAYKQAGWSLAPEKDLLDRWLAWCAVYTNNDPQENMKLWNSIRDTQVGWSSFSYRAKFTHYEMFNSHTKDQITPIVDRATIERLAPPPKPEEHQQFTEVLTGVDCSKWFRDCAFVESMGLVFTPTGRFMNSTQFNGKYGGKKFMVDDAGQKLTDEPWKAALRSTLWTIPKVDHIRFAPNKPSYAIIKDERGRTGVNIYLPIRPKISEGDVSPWTQHVAKILPNIEDQKILHAYMAHCVKFPGIKINWAVLLQSGQGVGKTKIFTPILQHCLGAMHVHQPKAAELVGSGSTFNAWMRGKLMIIIDEIKIDERRELSEILKPMITDDRIEIQAKGVDQEMEDNPTNWLFFSNYKDAIPVGMNDRRYCVFYSALQTAKQIIDAGITDAYLTNMFDWLRNKRGFEIIAAWLLSYPIELGQLPARAPHTSSYSEVINIGRSPIEAMLDVKIESRASGFKNGFVSLVAFQKSILAVRMKLPAEHVLDTILQNRGYSKIGYTSKPVTGEEIDRSSMIYSTHTDAQPDDYLRSQT